MSLHWSLSDQGRRLGRARLGDKGRDGEVGFIWEGPLKNPEQSCDMNGSGLKSLKPGRGTMKKPVALVWVTAASYIY